MPRILCPPNERVCVVAERVQFYRALVAHIFTKLMDPGRRGRTSDAYLWGYHAPHEQEVVLEFAPTRTGDILYDFFPSRWAGIAPTDGAPTYTLVFRHRPGIVHSECWANLRRYVLEATKSGNLLQFETERTFGQ